jgi:LPS export ABC transporter protein LptC
MIYRVLAVLLVVGLLGTVLFLGRGASDRDQPATAEAPTEEAGYSAREAEIVETGGDGKPLYRLLAAHIEQRPGERTVALEDITMSYHSDRGDEWRLRADRGSLPEDASTVQLSGAVRLTGPLGGTDRELAVATDRLSVDMRQQVATTDAPVTLNWSGQTLASIGLAANLKDQIVQLESKVHGRFAPP